MMSKAANFMSRLGSMDANIGERPEDHSVPTTVEEADTGMFAGRVREKGVALIDLDRIIADPDQPRKNFDQTDLDELAADIKRIGLLHNIGVRWSYEHEAYVILYGERRFRAAKQLEWKNISAKVHEKELSEAEKLEIQIRENEARADLDPIERAESYKRLAELGGESLRSLASRLDMSPSKMSRLTSYLKLPEDIKSDLSSGAVPEAIAREVIKLDNAEEQREFVGRYKAGDLTTREVREQVKERTSGKPKSGRKAATPSTIKLKQLKTADGIQVVVHGKRKDSQEAVGLALCDMIRGIAKDGRSNAAPTLLEEVRNLAIELERLVHLPAA